MKTLQAKKVVTQFKVLGITVLKKERIIFFQLSELGNEDTGASKSQQGTHGPILKKFNEASKLKYLFTHVIPADSFQELNMEIEDALMLEREKHGKDIKLTTSIHEEIETGSLVIRVYKVELPRCCTDDYEPIPEDDEKN